MKSVLVKTVDDYLAGQPADVRAVLARIRAIIKTTAPDAVEKMSYQIPLYFYNGQLVGFAGFKHHCSLFVTGSKVFQAYKKELEPFDVKGTKSTIRFAVGTPLPDALVAKIVRFRVKENTDRAKKTGKL